MSFLEEDREARTHARGLRAACGTFIAALLFWVAVATLFHAWNNQKPLVLEQASAIVKK